jgi:hypothetical protein
VPIQSTGRSDRSGAQRAIWVGSVYWIAYCPSVGHAGAVDTDRPEKDAHGRVTNLERYQLVADAATALVGKLVESFDVTRRTVH